jgi:hypothetical protein
MISRSIYINYGILMLITFADLWNINMINLLSSIMIFCVFIEVFSYLYAPDKFGELEKSL